MTMFSHHGTSYSYNPDGNDSSLSSETVPYIAGHSVVYSYDNGRRSQMQLTDTSIGTAGILPAVTACYSRIPGSSPVLTTTHTYDNLNILTSIGTAGILPAASVSYSYDYNNHDQRSKATLADGSYWEYSYDQYGQVTSGEKHDSTGAKVPNQQFGYAFDSIGNRSSENRNGNIFSYTPNNLNQYTQRTVPNKLDISGVAEPAAKVTIQKMSLGNTAAAFSKLADRTSKYFSKEYVFDNSSNPVSEAFRIFAVSFDQNQNKDIISKQLVDIFIPKTPEAYTYDPDGNLTSDGRFTYTWDAENRLVSLQCNTGILPVNRIKVDFAYDYMGRRVSKTVYSWDSNTNAYSLVPVASYKFAYDGWNLIAKFNASNALQESYLWGEDLSGSLQGAGGMGGLLAVSGSSGTYIPAYDGNGNIMAYVDASNGNKVAEYEYDAFGRTIVKAGVKADDMAYRFSTKYLDNETGDYYYGYRYYNADTGRWKSRDPIQEIGFKTYTGIKGKAKLEELEPLYVFVNNNPISYLDYLGLEKPSSPCKSNNKAIVLTFNGDTLGSWLAVSGVPETDTTEVDKTVQVFHTSLLKGGHPDIAVTTIETKRKTKFVYNDKNQKWSWSGPIPAGKYWLTPSEEANWTNAIRHTTATDSWGNYSWPLHAYPETNTFGRGGFFLHGGTLWGSAGCIDVKNSDALIHSYFGTFDNKPCCYVDVIVEYSVAEVFREDRLSLSITTREIK
jgi:RHS repeat-associated protein